MGLGLNEDFSSFFVSIIYHIGKEKDFDLLASFVGKVVKPKD